MRPLKDNLSWLMSPTALFGVVILAAAAIVPHHGSRAAAADFNLTKKASVQSDEEDAESGENSPEEKKSTTATVQGFVEYENFTGTYPHQEFSDIVKKNEFRGNITWRAGSEQFFFFLDSNMYVNNYNHDPVVYRNLTTRASSFEINFNRLYYNAELSLVRLRAGNQVHEWGTADVFNPTSYFNPMDMREALFRDTDELRQGVPSISSLFYLGDDTLELVFVPLHVPVLLPEENTFWELRYEEEGYPIRIDKSGARKMRVENMALGIQYYRNMFSTDINISAYYGPDTEPLFRPISTDISIPNEPVGVSVKPEYYNTVKLGMALSRGWNDFVFQFETAYSPLKTGVVDQDISGGQLPSFPFETETFHALYTSAGFNYMIPMGKIIEGHEGDAVFTMEYSRPTFFSDRVMDPMLGDVLIIRLEDTFMNSQLKVMITGIVDITEKGTIIMPEVQYRFDSGLSLSAAYIYIHGSDRSVTGMYTDNDFIKMRVRYEYRI